MNQINLTQPTLNCPLCGRSSRLAQVSPAPGDIHCDIHIVGDYRYYFCLCGLYYAMRYMGEDEIHEYYSSGEYRLHLSGALGISDELLRSETEHAGAIAPRIYERVQRCRSVLDIGCSSGVLLAQLLGHYNCTVHGVEWSWRLRDYCKNERGIKCYSDMNAVTETYDLIVLSHVLEHTLKPMELLRDIYAHLDGRLFVQVPLMMPGIPHPLVFTESSAVWMIERAGYKILSAFAERNFFSVWAVNNG